MRSLILAGGGIKVGVQAGVLQVWLDEAGIEFDHADGASGGRSPPPRGTPSGLSEREIEVLRLMTQGLSNREIGGRLFISARTAEHHVQHIYTKIGASTRAAAAMFAMHHNLVE